MRNRRAQTTAEYAVLIAVVVGALLAMQIYVKRGAMGRIKEATDQVGDQFSPLRTTSKATKHYEVERQEVLTTAGQTTSSIQGTEKQETTGGTEDVQALTAESKVFE